MSISSGASKGTSTVRAPVRKGDLLTPKEKLGPKKSNNKRKKNRISSLRRWTGYTFTKVATTSGYQKTSGLEICDHGRTWVRRGYSHAGFVTEKEVVLLR